jgi:hypothetical protein
MREFEEICETQNGSSQPVATDCGDSEGWSSISTWMGGQRWEVFLHLGGAVLNGVVRFLEMI